MKPTVLLILLALASCSLNPQRKTPPSRHYDLGSPEAGVAAAPCDSFSLATLRAAPMLASNTMWYRFNDDPVQPQAFAVSRWAAEPAALLEQALRVAMNLPDAGRRDGQPFRLSLQLETMEQQFSSRTNSAVRLIVSASLTRTVDRALVANRVLDLQQPADASPAGGAAAFGELAGQLAAQLGSWTCGQIEQ